jgi:hypothetical protein
MSAKFKKPFKDLFAKQNNSYRALNESVRLRETLYTNDRLTMYNDLFDMLYDKEVGGEYINNVYPN